MNKLINITGSILLISMAANTAAADELISRANYGDELDQCITEIREQLGVADDRALRHTVTEISKDGAWYRFQISTEAVSSDDSMIEIASASCKANRFNADTRLSIEKEDQYTTLATL